MLKMRGVKIQKAKRSLVGKKESTCGIPWSCLRKKQVEFLEAYRMVKGQVSVWLQPLLPICTL
jgi:hypothetical protein